MAYGTVNADVIGTSVANTSLGAGDASMLKNRIINGAMVIDQRNSGASGTGTNLYTVDRWAWYTSQTGKFTWGQNLNSVTALAGFSNYFGFQSSSAFSVASTDYFQWIQQIEGFNTADLAWGTANAKTVTLSFWVYSSLTGTFAGGLQNSAGNRAYPFTYTISSANTWTQISVTIAGDTTGTWVGATNGVGISVRFNLGSGSNYQSTANTWGATGAFNVNGTVQVVGTNLATFYITGVQLEVGSSATGYEYRQYQQELALCQRYYQLNQIGTALDVTSGATYGGNCYYGTQMRVSATVVWINSTAAFRFPTTAPSIQVATSQGFQFYKAANGSGATGSYTDLISSSAEL